ncbi:MAG: AarF/ABC1/UbiB kinase family protein [Acidimicrobiales bacterium]|nr:AarF/ABC1/UbiB kinase family protein [Acidimicrobiales bacterium]
MNRSVRLAVFAAAAVGTAAWWRRLSNVDDPKDGSVAARSRTQRNLVLAGAATKVGGAWAADRARRVFADAERRAELDEAFQLRTAEQVAETLGNLKGAMMKLGQMVSYLDQGMPEPVRDALAQLQQDAPPMAPELAAQVITEELGAPPAEVFAEWDPVPIAAASIGQVHRAMTHDGRAVAVKVQYPGVDVAIEGDLDNAGMLFTTMKYMFPGLDPKPLVAELRERITEELDYRIEADNQRLFADYYRDHPFIHVPDVIDGLGSRRVITTELVAGARFSEVTSWPVSERDRVGEIIYRFVFGSLYRLGAFNGDPHPGNYIFGADGRVSFLDYGLVKRFTPEELLPFEQMIDAAVINPDRARFRRIVEGVGLIKPGLDFTDEQVERYFGHFYEFVKDDEARTFDAEYASEMVARFFDTSSEHAEIMKAANVPQSMVIIQRINLGLMAVLGELGATARWREISEEIWPWVGAEPRTELGRAEAEWRRRTGRGRAVVERDPSPVTASGS